MTVYLASTSPARLMLLRSSGIEPVIVPSDVDEDAAVRDAEQNGQLSARDMVLLLARMKAEAVRAHRVDGEPLDGFIIGGDSAFLLDGVIYGKPHLPEVARERWQIQRGRTGELHSGHWVIDHRGGTPGPAVGAVATASVTFAADIADDELDAYVDSGEPLKVAGAFTIDSLGAPFITHVDGDPSTVVGLSLPALRRSFAELGVFWPSLWNRGRGAL
ncbi:Maf family protein [Okibacterium endophyticum]